MAAEAPRARTVLVWGLVVVACVMAIGLVLVIPWAAKVVGLVYGAF